MKVLRQIKAFHFLFTGLLLAFLSACGGGGGTSDPGFIGGGIDDPGGGGSGTATITVVLTDTDGNPTSTISSDSPGIVTVTVVSAGSAAADQVVNASVTVGGISPDSALTNADGIASFVLEAAGQSGAGTASFTVQDLDITGSVNFEISSAAAGNNVISLSLTDSAGNPVNNITTISPGILTATVTDAFGQPVADEILTALATLGSISPASGTALTDLNGVATFTISSTGVLGAGTVTVSLGATSSSLNYQIGEANLRLGRVQGSTFIEGEIDAGATALPAAGSTTLSVTVVDASDTPVSSTVPVQFGSGCAALGLSLISELVNTVNGVATSTYTATGCTGADTVTAAIVGGNTQTASVVLDIGTAAVNSILFLDANPTTIALQGTGGAGRSETSEVFFGVLDDTGAPAAGVDVNFSLSTTIGGLALTNNQATTTEDGIARAIVQAGNVSTSVRVTATIDIGGTQLSTVSDRLIVSTGLPDQNSVSMGPVKKNPGGFDSDGVTTEVTVRMADKFNNPVPDGTVAFFTTEYGSIGDSCELLDGVCSVTWTSQAPRLPLIYNDDDADGFVSTIFNRDCPDYIDPLNPTDPSIGRPCPSNLGAIIAGSSAITVIAVGEESFIDTNGNGLYDLGEPFEDLPEAFLDKNLNGVFDNTPPLCTVDRTTEAGRECAEGQEEIFFDFNEDGVYNQANGIYNGSLCPLALESAGQCTRQLLHVRGTNVIQMSSATGQIATIYEDPSPPGGPQLPLEVVRSITMASGGGSRDFLVAIADVYNNLPPAETTVSVTANGCEIISNDRTVPSIGSSGAFLVGFTVKNIGDNTEAIDGEITIEATVPDGLPAQAFISCVDAPN